MAEARMGSGWMEGGRRFVFFLRGGERGGVGVVEEVEGGITSPGWEEGR